MLHFKHPANRNETRSLTVANLFRQRPFFLHGDLLIDIYLTALTSLFSISP
ncbi:hypothetical protein DSUL_50015 [Desulfovibrionales bacterium]